MDNETDEYNHRTCLSLHFGWWTHDRFAPSILRFSEILTDRVVGLFNDVEGERQRIADEILRWPGWGEDTYAAMEAASEQSLEAAVEFMEMRGVFLATGISGLFHLFERQLYLHVNKELRGWLTKPVNQWRDLEELIPRFTRKWEVAGEDRSLVEAFLDRDLVELRLVANAVKHGRGPSYEKLLASGAPVVRGERLADEWALADNSVLEISLSISPADVGRYRDALLRFWKLEGGFWAHRSAFG